MTTSCSLGVSVAPDVMGTIRSTFRALEAAELDDSAQALYERLVGSPRLVEIDASSATAGGIYVRLAPFAELALREAKSIAQSTAGPMSKARRIREVVTLAGF